MAQIDYAALDRPEILRLLFYPRAEWRSPVSTATARDVLIPVAEAVAIGARFHMTRLDGPNILFFHGNGEIAADYDDLGPVYNRIGINFLVVDYRGYGRSTGQPTVTAMMHDCHAIFDFVTQWLKDNNYRGPLVLMGRSLGSASVLELAARYSGRIDGLIVESGFAYAGPLLELLGVDLEVLRFREEQGFRNVDKIQAVAKPTLIIHAERDHIIPFADAQALYDASPAGDKTLLKIPDAGHNDLFQHGFTQYLAAIKSLADKVKSR